MIDGRRLALRSHASAALPYPGPVVRGSGGEERAERDRAASEQDRSMSAADRDQAVIYLESSRRRADGE